MMKHTPIAVFLLLICGLAASGQETPVARLIEEIGMRSTCEHHQAMLDHFFAELSNNPTDQGYVIIYQPGADARSVVSRERELRNWIGFRRYDPARVTVVRGTVQTDAQIQFWRVPPGAENPVVRPATAGTLEEVPIEPTPEHEFVAKHNPDRAYLYVEYYDDDDFSGCVSSSDETWENELAKRLKTFPGSRGNIVIHKPSKAEFREKEKDLVAKMVSYGIPRSRLRTFHVRSGSQMVQLWVLPPRAAVSGNNELRKDVARLTADIKRYPEDADAYIQRARAYVSLASLGLAIADLTKAIELSKHPYYIAQATMDRGEVYMKQKAYDRAIADFTAVIGLKSADAYKPRAFLNRASAYHPAGKSGEALRDVDAAIELYSASKSGGSKNGLAEAVKLRETIKGR